MEIAVVYIITPDARREFPVGMLQSGRNLTRDIRCTKLDIVIGIRGIEDVSNPCKGNGDMAR